MLFACTWQCYNSLCYSLTGDMFCDERLESGRLGDGVRLGGVGVAKERRGGRTCGETWTIVEPPERDMGLVAA